MQNKLQSKFTYIVKEEDKELPVKELLRRNFAFSARLRTKLKQNDCIYLNSAPTKGYIIPCVGDIIQVMLPDEMSDFEPEPIGITPLYEDDDLLIINKQPGYVVHPTKGKPSHTMANGIMQYMLDTNQRFKIRFVNRLDMDTSGILVVAKNSHSQDEFTKQMKNNEVHKKYIAVVKGILPDDKGTVCLPIGRPDPDRVERGVMENGHPSTTHYTVLERFKKGYSMIELLLETGRTHQIRVHMSHIGYPVVGDHLYGGENVLLIERQALHAYSLTFTHPITGVKKEIKAPLPEDMEKLVEKLRK